MTMNMGLAVDLVVVPGWVEVDTVSEKPLPGDIIDLDPSPSRVFEQDRVISRRPRAFFRWVYDLYLLVAQKSMDLIHIFSTPRPKTHVVEPHAVLHKSLLRVSFSARTNPHRRPPSNVIHAILTAKYTLQAQKRQKGFIELPALIPLAHRQNDMRHTVNLNHDRLQTLCC
jgi:hypothetical protein